MSIISLDEWNRDWCPRKKIGFYNGFSPYSMQQWYPVTRTVSWRRRRLPRHLQRIKVMLLYFDSILIPLHHLVDAYDRDSKAVASEASMSLEMAGLAIRKLVLNHMDSDALGIGILEKTIHRQKYFRENGFSMLPDQDHVLRITRSDLAYSVFTQERESLSFFRHSEPEYRNIIESYFHAFPLGARDSLHKAMGLSAKLVDSDVETNCLFAGLRDFSSHEAVRTALCMIEVSMYKYGSDAGVSTAGIVPYLADNPADDPWRRSTDGVYCYLYSPGVFLRLASNFISAERLRCIGRLAPGEIDHLHGGDIWRDYITQYHNILLEITEECELAGDEFRQGECMTHLERKLSGRLLSGKNMISWVAGAAKNIIPFVKGVDFKADNSVMNYLAIDFNRTILRRKSPEVFRFFNELDCLLKNISA